VNSNVTIWRDALRGMRADVLAQQHGVHRSRIYQIAEQVDRAVSRSMNQLVCTPGVRQALEGVTITAQAGCGDVTLSLDGGPPRLLRHALRRHEVSDSVRREREELRQWIDAETRRLGL